MYHEHTVCRACGYGANVGPGGIKAEATKEKLVPVLDLGVQPLANDFRKATEERAGFAPLRLLYCPRCTLAQLSVVVKPEILYSRYSYVTSPSQTMREHFQCLLADIATEQKPGPVVEIGSNDGLFLSFLGANSYGNLVGIDPATNLAERARNAGVTTINDFFGDSSAKAARQCTGEPALVIARHVFCHIDDWRGFIKSLELLCAKDTLVCIEVPYVVDQINAGSFDQVYHEHLSYLSIKALKALLNESPFHIHRVCHYPIHGGSIVAMLRRNDCLTPPHISVQKYLESESVTLETWEYFRLKTEDQRMALAGFVTGRYVEGKRFCGYGASAKSTVWVNACGFTRRELEFICDSTREKVQTFSPGTDIPIVHEGDHITSCVDYVILFAWNYADEILKRERAYAAKCLREHNTKLTTKWIVPVPEFKIMQLFE